MLKRTQRISLQALAAVTSSLIVVGVSFADTSTGGTPSTSPSSSPSTNPSSGGSAGTAGSGSIGTNAGTQGLAQRQIYTVQLNALNGSSVNGTMNFVADGNALGVTETLSGLDASISHQTQLHAGYECPTQVADRNRDGLIDAVEAQSVVGQAVLSFGFNSSGASSGSGNSSSGSAGSAGNSSSYPMPASDGNLDYIQSFSLGSLSSLNAGISNGSSTSNGTSTSGAPGTTPASNASNGSMGGTTTANADSIGLEGRTILVHGVGSSTILPSTIQTINNQPPNVTLPVACGVIVRVQE